MKKRYIASVLVMLSVLAGLGAIYQFYFKQQFERYAENKQILTDLEDRLRELEETFSKIRPDYVVQEWRGAVQPWAEAVNQRSRFFTMDDLSRIEPVPEGQIPRFHYEGVFPQMQRELLLDVYRYRCQIPQTTFGAPGVGTLSGRSVTKEEVETWLRQFAFGSAVMRFLMERRATEIRQIEIWPLRVEYGLLEMQTMGLAFTMTLENLVRFLESLNDENRYFNVNAIRVHNKYLRWPGQPPLEVEMLLTRAQLYQEDEGGKGGAEASEGEGGPPAELDPEKLLSNLRNVRETRKQRSGERKKSEREIEEEREMEKRRRRSRNPFFKLLRFFGF